MSKKPQRVEWVDRIIESLDVTGNRKGPLKQRFTLTRAQFREHLMTAYGNGRVSMYQQIKRAVELVDWRLP
jgi:hypothetical protein